MKKYILFLILGFLVASCSKKKNTIISGQISNASPLERIEILNTTSTTTLPITNIGLDAQGNFSDTIEIVENGLYAITYGRNMNFIYLKKGENIHISGNGLDFPEKMKITGDSSAEKNNAFLFAVQNFMKNYYLSLIENGVLKKDETSFLNEIKNMQVELDNKIKEFQNKYHPDKEVATWKKNELSTNILLIMQQYVLSKTQLEGSKFAPSDAFTKIEASIINNEEEWATKYPTFRSYLLMKLQNEFSKFSEQYKNQELSSTEIFALFLKNKKNITQNIKDQLLSYVSIQYDMSPENPRLTQALETLDKEIKNKQIKAELPTMKRAIQGLPIGTKAPTNGLIQIDGKAFGGWNGRASVMIFYASWTPFLTEMIKPIVAQIHQVYGEKVDIILINMDDTEAQYKKTSNALLKDLPMVKSLYAQQGLKSRTAQDYGIYGFKLPSAVLIDSKGNIASHSIMNITGPQLSEALSQLTGINATTPSSK